MRDWSCWDTALLSPATRPSGPRPFTEPFVRARAAAEAEISSVRVRSGLIMGSYPGPGGYTALDSLRLDVVVPRPHAWEPVGPRARRPLGLEDPVLRARRQVARQLPDARRLQLLAHLLDRGLDDGVAVASAHQVGPHRRVILGGRLDQHDLGARRHELLPLAAEPP